jgi:hypothetical protein
MADAIGGSKVSAVQSDRAEDGLVDVLRDSPVDGRTAASPFTSRSVPCFLSSIFSGLDHRLPGLHRIRGPNVELRDSGTRFDLNLSWARIPNGERRLGQRCSRPRLTNINEWCAGPLSCCRAGARSTSSGSRDRVEGLTASPRGGLQNWWHAGKRQPNWGLARRQAPAST